MRYVLLAMVLLTGCIADLNHDGSLVIGCLGDSNTDEHYVPIVAPTWCSRLATLNPNPNIPWTMENYGVSYSSAVVPPGLPEYALIATNELAVMLTSVPHPPDIIVFAYGTNDVRYDEVTPEAIVLALAAVDAQAEQAGVPARWFALIPPLFPGGSEAQKYDQKIQITNAMIQTAFPHRTVDLYTEFNDTTYFADGVHFNAVGQAKRAQVIFDTVK